MDKIELLELLKTDRAVAEAIKAAIKRRYIKPATPNAWAVDAAAILKRLILAEPRLHDRWFKSLDAYAAAGLNIDYKDLYSTTQIGNGLRVLADQGFIKIKSGGQGLKRFYYNSQPDEQE